MRLILIHQDKLLFLEIRINGREKVSHSCDLNFVVHYPCLRTLPWNIRWIHAAISVAIVEDDRDIRQLLSLIIDGSPGFTCKQSFNDCEMALPEIGKNPPDVVLMDIDLPGMSGIEGVRQLNEKLPETNFIMLTIKEDDDSIFDSVCAGATGHQGGMRRRCSHECQHCAQSRHFLQEECHITFDR